MRGAWLEELTWDVAAERLAAGWPVLVPVGAAAKAHGRHLPLDTDWLTARELAGRMAARLPLLAAPVVGFGYYPAFAGFAGSQHLRSETFQALMLDLLEGFVRQGVRRIAVLNTGVSTEAPLRLVEREIAARHGIAVHAADLRPLGRGADALLADPSGGHADERETSVLLAIAPQRVQLGRAADDPSGSGDPRAATAEKGRAILAAIEAELVAGLTARWPDLAGTTSPERDRRGRR